MKRPYDAVAPPAARYPIAPGAPPPVYDAYAPASGANPCFEFLRSGSCRNGDRCKYVHGPAPEDGAAEDASELWAIKGMPRQVVQPKGMPSIRQAKQYGSGSSR